VRHGDPAYALVADWGTPPEPRADGDPVLRAERAFLAGDTELTKQLGQEHLDDPDLEIFTLTAAALFLER
jgi:hypothetical protein